MSDQTSDSAKVKQQAAAQPQTPDVFGPDILKPDILNAGVLKPGALRPGVFVKTYGCQMNEYDSEKILKLLASNHRVVSAAGDADVVIVNTCSIREQAETKMFGLLGALAESKRLNPRLIVGVGGCVAQQEGAKLLKRSKVIDFVFGTHNLSLVPSLVESARAGRERQVAVDYREEWEELGEENHCAEDPVDLEALTGKSFGAYYSAARAMVAIQRGCNKHCSFCVVPNTRGPETSRDPQEVLREIRLKVRMGASEVLLLGQTVNSYGRDLNPRYSFERLISEIATLDGVKRIRFISPHPQEVRSSFVDLYRDVPQLVPHIHLPLQSGSDRVLKAMNRNYRVKRYLEIIDQLRERVPDIAITTDFIVGFPTETESEFSETLKIIERVRYDFSYSYKYSRRPHTEAGRLYTDSDEVDRETLARRLSELQQLQDAISKDINQNKVGSTVEVLVEGRSTRISSFLRGRIPQNTPAEVVVDCDDVAANIEGDRGPKTSAASVAVGIGQLVRVRVDHASAYGLRGQLSV